MNIKTYLKSGLFILAFAIILPSIASAAKTFFEQGFEDPFVDGAPAGWTKINKTKLTPVDWVREVGDAWYFDTAHGGTFNALLYYPDSGDHETYLITPPIEYPDTAPSVTLEFWHKQAKWDSDQDTLNVYYGLKATGPWTILATFESNVQSWTRRTINLPLDINSPFYVAFLGNAKHGYGVCIDDVRVYEGNGDIGQTIRDSVINCYAVVVGVSNYLDDDISDLQYCDDDAREVGQTLYALGNWKKENIVVLTDSAATKANIQDAFQNMADAADPNDIVFFFFSGHGFTGYEDLEPIDESDGFDEYIMTYDTSISDDELTDWFSALRTDRYAVFFDTCHSGGMIKGLYGAVPAGNVKGLGFNVPQPGDGFAADLTPLIGTKDLDDNSRGVIVTACDEGELAMESDQLQNSIFAYYLIEALKGLADDDADNSISAEECYEFIAPRAAAFNPGQNAQIYDAVPGELELSISNSFVSKCSVKAGKSPSTDSMSAKGHLTASTYTFEGAAAVTITIDSNNFEAVAYSFPVNDTTYKLGKFSSTLIEANAKLTFKYNAHTRKFSFTGKKMDLTGLDCPLTFKVDIGAYSVNMRVDESVVNGKKPIPINLLMGVADSLRVDKIQVKRGSLTDRLIVKGGFSVLADVNLVETDSIARLNEQSWTILEGGFTAKNSKFTCKKTSTSPEGIVDAHFDFTKGAFKLTIKNTDVFASPGTGNFFGIELPFYAYEESVEVDLR